MSSMIVYLQNHTNIKKRKLPIISTMHLVRYIRLIIWQYCLIFDEEEHAFSSYSSTLEASGKRDNTHS